MNIFIAGGTGAIGRVLVPLLVNAGHRVVALTRSTDRTAQLEQMGAVPVVGDVYDEVRLARLVAESEAEAVIHQLTAFGTKAGDPTRKRSACVSKGRAAWYPRRGLPGCVDSSRRASRSCVRRSVAD